MSALYQTYRPQRFADLIGQEPIRRTLQNALRRDTVSHAYLFAGPRGTGKTSIARILAKALNCAQGAEGDACGECPLCLEIAAGRCFDVVEQDAASQRGIDDIRELRSRSFLAPASGKEKVYIIDEAHQLTDAAWNALLKLIEEPPPHLHFIFCTTELEKVPETVRSRCQTFAFSRPSVTDLRRYLNRIVEAEQAKTSEAALELVAEQARGSFRDAATLLNQLLDGSEGPLDEEQVRSLLGLTSGEQLSRMIEALAARDSAALLLASEELASSGADFTRVSNDLAEHLRKLLVAKHLGGGDVAEAEQFEEVQLLDLLDQLLFASTRRGDPRSLFELALLRALAES